MFDDDYEDEYEDNYTEYDEICPSCGHGYFFDVGMSPCPHCGSYGEPLSPQERAKQHQNISRQYHEARDRLELLQRLKQHVSAQEQRLLDIIMDQVDMFEAINVRQGLPRDPDYS